MKRERSAVLVIVKGGVAYPYAGDFVEVVVVDRDGIEAGDGPQEIPDTPAFRALCKEADVRKGDVKWMKP